MPRPAKPFDLARLFAALADPTRLRLLNLMNGREVCVCYFVVVLKQSQPKISRHLAYLRRSGIVTAHREGKWMHYRIAAPSDPAALAVFNAALTSLATNPAMQRDLTQLDKTCCAPGCFAALKGAPPPLQLNSPKAAPRGR